MGRVSNPMVGTPVGGSPTPPSTGGTLMPSTERRLARWRGLTMRPSSDRSPGGCSAAGTSYRSNGSTRTGSQDGRNAEKDGGSSFVVSPQQQLYRLHDSD